MNALEGLLRHADVTHQDALKQLRAEGLKEIHAAQDRCNEAEAKLTTSQRTVASMRSEITELKIARGTTEGLAELGDHVKELAKTLPTTHLDIMEIQRVQDNILSRARKEQNQPLRQSVNNQADNLSELRRIQNNILNRRASQS